MYLNILQLYVTICMIYLNCWYSVYMSISRTREPRPVQFILWRLLMRIIFLMVVINQAMCWIVKLKMRKWNNCCIIRKKILSAPETIEKLSVETEPCVVDFSWSHTQSNVVRRIDVMQARYIIYLYHVSMIYWILYIPSERWVRSRFQWKSSQMWEIIATSACDCCKKRHRN